MSYFKESNVLKKVKSESEVAQLCPTLCDPMDYSLSGSSIRGIFQARILSWMTFPSPGDLPDPGTKYLIVNAAHIHIRQMPFKVKVKSLSRV